MQWLGLFSATWCNVVFTKNLRAVMAQDGTTMVAAASLIRVLTMLRAAEKVDALGRVVS